MKPRTRHALHFAVINALREQGLKPTNLRHAQVRLLVDGIATEPRVPDHEVITRLDGARVAWYQDDVWADVCECGDYTFQCDRQEPLS